MAGRLGFEPRISLSKSDVLPVTLTANSADILLRRLRPELHRPAQDRTLTDGGDGNALHGAVYRPLLLPLARTEYETTARC